jgi:hypothetical protein
MRINTVEIQCMSNVQTELIPVITGAHGTMSKSLRKYLSNISGKHTIKELQETAILGPALILEKVLMQKYRTFNVGNTMTRIRNYNYRTAATLYTVEKGL